MITADDLFRTPGPTIRRVLDVLRERRHPGAPERLSMDWTDHFGAGRLRSKV